MSDSRPIYSCVCGAMSSSPINHNHPPYPTRPEPKEEKCR
jgi:hypothetical protein